MYKQDKDIMRNVLRVQKFVVQSMDPKERGEKRDEGAVKEAAFEVLASYTGKLGKGNRPDDAVDQAIFDRLEQQRDDINEAVEARAAETTPSTLDYYAVFYKTMKDSGLIRNTLVDPGLVAVMDQWRVANARDSCSACGACGACGACAVCAACVATAAGATGVAGLTAGTIGTGGTFF